MILCYIFHLAFIDYTEHGSFLTDPHYYFLMFARDKHSLFILYYLFTNLLNLLQNILKLIMFFATVEQVLEQMLQEGTLIIQLYTQGQTQGISVTARGNIFCRAP